MNKLSTAKRVQIVKALVEGNSLRSITRMVGCSINTVTKLLVDLGAACEAIQTTAGCVSAAPSSWTLNRPRTRTTTGAGTAGRTSRLVWRIRPENGSAPPSRADPPHGALTAATGYRLPSTRHIRSEAPYGAPNRAPGQVLGPSSRHRGWRKG